MKKTFKISKALATATGIAVFGSVIACGAALLAMKEGFKTAGKIVQQAAKEDEGTVVEQEPKETKINNSETSCEQIENNQEV